MISLDKPAEDIYVLLYSRFISLYSRYHGGNINAMRLCLRTVQRERYSFDNIDDDYITPLFSSFSNVIFLTNLNK